jgi:general secretion pathway protein B
MSFILDALRKSEHERQRHTGPTLVAVPGTGRPARTPWVFLGLGFLLALNLLGLIAFWIWRDGKAPGPGIATGDEVPQVIAATSPAVAAGTPPIPAPAERLIRPLTGETVDSPPESTLPAPPATPDPGLLPPMDAVGPAQRPASVTLPPPSSGQSTIDSAGVPTIDQLSPAATAGLPTLNLDLHVYQPDAARRFVFINGTRYAEGAALKEGPVVERINRDGAVLNHHGLRFLLERP